MLTDRKAEGSLSRSMAVGLRSPAYVNARSPGLFGKGKPDRGVPRKSYSPVCQGAGDVAYVFREGFVAHDALGEASHVDVGWHGRLCRQACKTFHGRPNCAGLVRDYHIPVCHRFGKCLPVGGQPLCWWQSRVDCAFQRVTRCVILGMASPQTGVG